MKKGLMFTALACALTMGLASCGNENDTPAIVITVQSLRISGDFKTVYKVGEAFDSTGMVVTATFSNGQTADIPAGGYTLDVPDMSTAGTKTVTVTCQGVTAKVTITVEPETYTVTIENKDKFADPWKVGDYESLSIRIPGVKVGDAVASGELVITSSDQSVAKTEEKSLVITAAGVGTATITATFRGEYSDSVEITVEKAPVYKMVNQPVAGTQYVLAHKNEKNVNELCYVGTEVSNNYWLRFEWSFDAAAKIEARVVDEESEYKYALDIVDAEGNKTAIGIASTGVSKHPYAAGPVGTGQCADKDGGAEFTRTEAHFKIDEQYRLLVQHDDKVLVLGSQTGYNTTGFDVESAIGVPAHLWIESEEEIPATGITVSPESVEIVPGGTANLSVALTPMDSTDNVSFKSSKEDVATVDSKGTITGVAEGSAVITVTANDNVFAEVPVTVAGEGLNFGTRENPLSITDAKKVLDVTGADLSSEALYVTGEVYSSTYSTRYGNYTIWLKDGNVNQAFEFYATIGEDGIDMASIAEGDVISAYGFGKIYNGTYELTNANDKNPSNPTVYSVTKGVVPPLESVSLNKTELTLASGESYNLKVVPNPARAELPAVSWASSDPEVATVDQEGKVTAVKEGTATITVTVTGFDPLYCAVTVDDSGGGESHDGSESSPFTPDEAIAKAEETGTTATSEEYYVRGTVKAITYTWKNGTMSCTLEGSNDKVFTLFKLACTEDESKTIVAGQSIVTAKGKIVNYNSNTPEFSNGCTLIKVENPEIELESVALSESEVELALNQEKTLSVVPTPAGAKLPDGITWESSDAETVSVANGLIKGLKAGSATITVHVPEFDDLTCAVTVKDEEINYGTEENPLSVADAIALLDKLVPTQGTWTDEEVWVTGIVHDATFDSKFSSWTINLYNDEVEQGFQIYSSKLAAGLDGNNLQDGAVVVAHGPAKIHTNGMHELAYNSKTTVSPEVTSIEYTKPSLTSVSLNKDALEVKEEATFQLEVIPNPAQADLPEGITWESSDEEVATVSESGLVTGVKAGTATITVSVPGFDDLTCAVTVVEKGEAVEKVVTLDVAAITAGGFTSTAGAQTYEADGLTITLTNGLADGQIRIYKNETIKFAASNIKSIVFNCSASGTTKYGPGCFAEQDGYSYEDAVGTWTGSAAEVSFTASSNQVRALTIVITYVA